MAVNQNRGRKTKKNKAQSGNALYKRRIQRRLWLTFAGVCILFVVLIARIMYIQYTSGEKYEKIVLAQQDYDSTTIPFQRGNIIDSKGTVLATSVDVYNVILDSYVLNAHPDCIDTTARLVDECFENIERDTISTFARTNPSSTYYVLAKKVSYEEMAAFLEAKDLDENKDKIYGIWFEKEYVRKYPYGSLAAATLGFASGGNVGVIGLECEYSSTLNGINGRTYGYLNSDSNLEQTTIDAQNGNNIILSLDVNIQQICEKAILDWNKEHEGEDGSLGSNHTAVLCMNPQNGEILAMAQYPQFDLNNPRDLSGFYSEEEISVMSEDEKMDKLNAIWQNFPITFTYEPGSTAKPFTVAAGLETGKLSGNETYFCDGYQMVSGYQIKCVAYKRGGHGTQDIAMALSNSCNDALMQMVDVIGSKTFHEYQQLFGFGQKTFIDLPGEASTAGLIFTEEELHVDSNLATSSFGQSFNTTMVQLGSAFCSIINGGNLYQPHLVTRITDSNGNTIEEIEPNLLKKTVSKETSDILVEDLEKIVETGTAKTAGVEGYRIGGKTGTAEKFPREAKNYLVSFIGFAPVDDPQIVVYVVIDVPNVDDQAHSSYAQTIAKSIFEQALPYLGVNSSLTAEEEAAAANARTEAEKPEEEQTPEGE